MPARCQGAAKHRRARYPLMLVHCFLPVRQRELATQASASIEYCTSNMKMHVCDASPRTLQLLDARHKLNLSDEYIHKLFREADWDYSRGIDYNEFLGSFSGACCCPYQIWTLWFKPVQAVNCVATVC